MMDKNEKIYVAGHRGMVGSAIVRELERQGYIYTVKGKGNFASGSEMLIDRYKEEIQKQLREICKTAISIGMTEEELMNGIREWRKI